jgi:hypothetical protein
MEATVVRTGGFAGVHERIGPVDADSLDGALGLEIEAKVEEIGFFDLPPELPERLIYDGFRYRVTVTVGDRTHSVRYGDGTEDRRGVNKLVALMEKSGPWFKAEAGLAAEFAAESFQWEAWYNRMSGVDDKDLHVAGKVGLPSSQAEVTLEPYNDGIVDDPSVFVLKLTVVMPGVGDTRYVERDVGWHGNAGPDIKTVRICGDVSGEMPVGERV